MYLASLRFAQISSLRLETSDTPGTLCAIRKPAFGKGDRKFMTLLPSFNGQETQTGTETPTGRDYLITGIKWLTTFDPNFLISKNRWFY